jgi:hypothetical protein
MNTLVNVGRYHLVDRITWLALPWKSWRSAS